MNAITKAAKYLDVRDGRTKGGQAVIARHLDVTPQAVSEVANGNRPIPKSWVFELTKMTVGHVTPFDCRPDLYPDPDWLPPDVRKLRRKRAG